jgi:Spy/CpxP family protein refolding chaperone
MKTKSILSLAIIMMLSFFLLVSLPYAQAPEKQQKRIKAGLELTPEQKENIRKTRLNFQKDKIKLKADLKIAQLELKSLLREEKLNRGEIYGKIEYLGDLKTQLAKNRLDQRMAIRDILTKEQLEKLKERKFKRSIGKRLMQHRGRQQRPFRQGRHFMERPHPQGDIGMLSPETEPLSPMEAEEFFFEPAELAQLLDELPLLEDLVEPVPLFEEMELLPLLEEEFPPLPEEPEIVPFLDEE